MVDNLAMEILTVIHRNPRVSPALIHAKMKMPMTFSTLEFSLRTLRETGQIKTLARGIYIITRKGVETLRSSEKTQEDKT